MGDFFFVKNFNFSKCWFWTRKLQITKGIVSTWRNATCSNFHFKFVTLLLSLICSVTLAFGAFCPSSWCSVLFQFNFVYFSSWLAYCSNFWNDRVARLRCLVVLCEDICWITCCDAYHVSCHVCCWCYTLWELSGLLGENFC